MVDIPEYLLERSRERRQLLTGQDPGGPAEATATSAAPATVEAAASPAAPAQPAPQVLAPVPAPAPPPPPEPPTSPWVVAATTRKRIPLWVMPVLLFLPIWGFLYVGTLESPSQGETGLLGEGEEVYVETAACSSCHGFEGQGTSSGPQINAGELLLTFPDDPDGLGLAQQIAWVVKGTNGTGVGRPYGNPERGRVAGWFGEMAAFGDSLTSEQLIAVVLYERAVHDESEPARTTAAIMEEMLESGELVLPEAFAADVTVEEIQELLAPVFAHEQEEAAEDG